eukprot:g4587.t1
MSLARQKPVNRRKLSGVDGHTSVNQQGPTLLDLKTIYEGPGGQRSARMLHKTNLVVTNRTVEIEREGVNVVMTVLTCGCWWLFFQTASIEIYELERIQTLYLKDDVIYGELVPEAEGRQHGGTFAIDVPLSGDKTTKDLFFELKESWTVARHTSLGAPEDGLLSGLEDGDQLLIGQDNDVLR